MTGCKLKVAAVLAFILLRTYAAFGNVRMPSLILLARDVRKET